MYKFHTYFKLLSLDTYCLLKFKFCDAKIKSKTKLPHSYI